jgi:hypothetical protein
MSCLDAVSVLDEEEDRMVLTKRKIRRECLDLTTMWQ